MFWIQNSFLTLNFISNKEKRYQIINMYIIWELPKESERWQTFYKIALIIFILTVFLQELEAVIEPLGAHVTENGGVGRKQGPGDSVEIPTGQLHASVGQYNMLKVGRVVRRTNVALPGKRRHCDGFIVQDWQIVAQASIHISLQYRTV